MGANSSATPGRGQTHRNQPQPPSANNAMPISVAIAPVTPVNPVGTYWKTYSFAFAITRATRPTTPTRPRSGW